uniref:protein-tyrosine-phosphatase n=1 Tax=Angiostrongylus cantonensis TaxID=6313 RepID=A0A0K0DNF6_ANGCA
MPLPNEDTDNSSVSDSRLSTTVCTSCHVSVASNKFGDINRHSFEDHDYIHANWVDGYREPKKFIITQAPLPHTTNQFWKMLWQEKCLVVVSMIQMFDVTGAEWTSTYIPKKTGETCKVEDINLVHCGTRCVRETYDATLIKVSYKEEERLLLHLCYFSWGYRGTPKNPTEVLNFISDINYNRELLIKQAVGAGWLKPNESSPITIHCLAGTARSAMVTALDICLRKLDDTARRKCGPLVDVEDVVLRLRTQRAMAIQVNEKIPFLSCFQQLQLQSSATACLSARNYKPEQYLFIHLAVFEYAVRQGYIPDEMYKEIDLEGFFYEKKQTEERQKK